MRYSHAYYALGLSFRIAHIMLKKINVQWVIVTRGHGHKTCYVIIMLKRSKS